jgi:hypothetical protein
MTTKLPDISRDGLNKREGREERIHAIGEIHIAAAERILVAGIQGIEIPMIIILCDGRMVI